MLNRQARHETSANPLIVTHGAVREQDTGLAYNAFGDGWLLVGPAVFKAVVRRAERLGCVRFARIPAKHCGWAKIRKDGLFARKVCLMKDEAPLYGTSSASCLRELEVIKVSEGGAQEITETVAVEAAVKISYGIGITKSVSLSPKDLYDYTLGHAFTSGIISSPDDLIDFALCTDSDPMKIVATVRKDLNLKDIQTSRAKQGGVFEEPGTSLPPEAIWSINETLLSKQELHQLTGATHAASFVGFDGELLYIREDVGRHNAVEKLIGALLSNKVDPREGFAFLSSRCALELVQKLACYGIRTIAAISAPTSAVIDYALSQGITICAFSRGKRFTVYTHPERLSIHLD